MACYQINCNAKNGGRVKFANASESGSVTPLTWHEKHPKLVTNMRSVIFLRRVLGQNQL